MLVKVVIGHFNYTGLGNEISQRVMPLAAARGQHTAETGETLKTIQTQPTIYHIIARLITL